MPTFDSNALNEQAQRAGLAIPDDAIRKSVMQYRELTEAWRLQSDADKLTKQITSAGLKSGAQAAQEQAQAQQIHKIDRENEKLTATLDDLGLWSDKEKKYLESIDPTKERSIIKFDDKGEPKETKENVSGQEVRDSLTIAKAFTNTDKLNEKAKEELNEALHNGKEPPKTLEQHEKRAKKLERISEVIAGDAAQQVDASNALTSEQKKEAIKKIGESLKPLSKSVEKQKELIKEIEKTKDSKETLEPQQQQLLKNAEEQVAKDMAKIITPTKAQAELIEQATPQKIAISNMQDVDLSEMLIPKSTAVANRNSEISSSKAAR